MATSENANLLQVHSKIESNINLLSDILLAAGRLEARLLNVIPNDSALDNASGDSSDTNRDLINTLHRNVCIEEQLMVVIYNTIARIDKGVFGSEFTLADNSGEKTSASSFISDALASKSKPARQTKGLTRVR